MMTDKYIVFDGYPFADKCMRLNPDAIAYDNSFLNLDECPDHAVFADPGSIKIDKRPDDRMLADSAINDILMGIRFHKNPSWFLPQNQPAFSSDPDAWVKKECVRQLPQHGENLLVYTRDIHRLSEDGEG